MPEINTDRPDVILLSTYELGRQPFGVASPAAWLREAGFTVQVQDLALCSLDPDPVETARVIGIYVPMHTATRLAEPLLGEVRRLNPEAHVVVYGLYGPLNRDRLLALGADTVLGGEFEEGLVETCRRVVSGDGGPELPLISLARQQFRVPDRSGLPSLDRYAGLQIGGEIRVTGYTEASRGCKYHCRHCPIVPVYEGTFRVVAPEVVLADIANQVAAGARHLTFGDPDFFNGPAHAMRVVRGLHEAFPDLTYDVTIKVEHLLRHAELLPELVETGCVLVTSALESFDDDILLRFDKRHTAAEAAEMVALLETTGLALNPTFVAFTPWTTRQIYQGLLGEIARLGLVEAVSPIQYGIRLLIPAGSKLFDLPGVEGLVGGFDESALAHPWSHPDPSMDRLQAEVMDIVTAGQQEGRSRREIFDLVWEAAGAEGPTPIREPRPPVTVPYLTEPWYC